MNETTNAKLVAARNEMMAKFGVTREQAEKALVIGVAVAQELGAPNGMELAISRDELLEVVERATSPKN